MVHGTASCFLGDSGSNMGLPAYWTPQLHSSVSGNLTKNWLTEDDEIVTSRQEAQRLHHQIADQHHDPLRLGAADDFVQRVA